MASKSEARKKALQALKSKMSSMGGESLGGSMSKVSVMADDKDDLKKGLKVAEKAVDKYEPSEEVEESLESLLDTASKTKRKK